MKSPRPVILIAMVVWALTCALPSSALDAGALAVDLEDLSLTELETRLREIDKSLQELASLSLRGGVGSIGYRSAAHATAENREWIQIDLQDEVPIDLIGLVPTIWRDPKFGFQPDAFPEAFVIRAGTMADSTGQVIAEFDMAGTETGLAPFMIDAKGVKASWVRIETTRLSRRSFDNLYVLQLAEIVVFSGQENVALLRPLVTSSNEQTAAGAWDNRYLVDGFMPYLMDSAKGEKSTAYVTGVGQVPVLTIDLGAAYPISHIHLHTVEQSDTVPQAYFGDLGLPRHMRIEGSTRPDFSDSVVMLDYRRDSINDTGPIIMRPIPDIHCRYVRFTAMDSIKDAYTHYSQERIGFAEIELLSDNRNVALGAAVNSTIDITATDRKLTALTDGNNLYGNILSVRDWLQQLAYRHELESERPVVLVELNHRYSRQKANLQLMTRLALLLGIAIAFTILIDRNIRMKQATRIKERFAADLHDELGANLHTLGLLSDLAKDAVEDRDELLELLDRTRVFTERSGMAARYCTNMLEAKGICEDLVDEMQRTTKRLLADLDYELTFEGEDILSQIRPQRRIDLFLFYKEALTNIIKHSRATRVEAHIKAEPKTIYMSITDNGHGMPSSGVGGNEIPPSLKRRTRLLRAKVSVESPSSGGTRIQLKLKRRRFIFFR